MQRMMARQVHVGFSLSCRRICCACAGPNMLLQKGAVLALKPDRTKTGARDGAMHVQVLGSIMCLPGWIHVLLVTSRRSSSPVTNFLTRMLNKSKSGFCEKGVSAAALNDRMKEHLKAAGLFEGHAIHGDQVWCPAA